MSTSGPNGFSPGAAFVIDSTDEPITGAGVQRAVPDASSAADVPPPR